MESRLHSPRAPPGAHPTSRPTTGPCYTSDEHVCPGAGENPAPKDVGWPSSERGDDLTPRISWGDETGVASAPASVSTVSSRLSAPLDSLRRQDRSSHRTSHLNDAPVPPLSGGVTAKNLTEKKTSTSTPRNNSSAHAAAREHYSTGFGRAGDAGRAVSASIHSPSESCPRKAPKRFQKKPTPSTHAQTPFTAHEHHSTGFGRAGDAGKAKSTSIHSPSRPRKAPKPHNDIHAYTYPTSLLYNGARASRPRWTSARSPARAAPDPAPASALTQCGGTPRYSPVHCSRPAQEDPHEAICEAWFQSTLDPSTSFHRTRWWRTTRIATMAERIEVVVDQLQLMKTDTACHYLDMSYDFDIFYRTTLRLALQRTGLHPHGTLELLLSSGASPSSASDSTVASASEGLGSNPPVKTPPTLPDRAATRPRFLKARGRRRRRRTSRPLQLRKLTPPDDRIYDSPPPKGASWPITRVSCASLCYSRLKQLFGDFPT